MSSRGTAANDAMDSDDLPALDALARARHRGTLYLITPI